MDKIKSYFQEIYRSVPFGWIILSILGLDVVSYASFQFPMLNTVTFFVISIIAFIASLKRLHYGILFIAAELAIGSFGYLFSFQGVSIRIALFCVVWLASAVWMIRERRITFFHWPLWKPYVAVVCMIAFGSIVGFMRGNDPRLIFLDANGYLYFGLIVPLVQAIRTRAHFMQLFGVLFAGVIALSVKTLVVLALFSQIEALRYTLPSIYTWIRDTRIGEITRYPSGFSRIFFQSHIYAVFVFFFLAPFFIRLTQWIQWKNSTVLRTYVLFGTTLLIIFLSYSRSFWVGNLAALFILSVWLLWRERIGFKRYGIAIVILLATFAVDYVVAFGIVNIPLPGNQGVSASSLLADRTTGTTGEVAAASRLQLLRPLASAAQEHILLGSGLGRTVTYRSLEPRNLQTDPEALYTTYAFEWGYLDFLLKFGIVGVSAYVYLLYRIIRVALEQNRLLELKNERLGFLASLAALLTVHMFTPYLNHPLGISWIAFISVALFLPNESRESSLTHEGK